MCLYVRYSYRSDATLKIHSDMIVNCLYAPKSVDGYLDYNLYAVIVCILQKLVSHEFEVVHHFQT